MIGNFESIYFEINLAGLSIWSQELSVYIDLAGVAFDSAHSGKRNTNSLAKVAFWAA